MRAVLRVDASSTIGSGHLSRCLTLGRALREAGLEVVVASREPTEHTKKWVDREGHDLVVIAGEERAASRAAAAGASLVVVDGYGFGPDLHAALRETGRVVAVMDDTATSVVRGDVVLNGNFFAEELRYEGVPETLLGPSYALVREEFRAARAAREARIASDTRRILVSMGGADPAGATEAFLEAIEALGAADVRVVVGGANPRVDAIRDAAARITGPTIELLVDVAQMSEPMLWCDVAVVAAGSTCLELACLGVPAVVVSVADNQDPVAAAVGRRGLMRSVGRFGASSGRDLVREVESLIADAQARGTMIAKQRETIDGLGPDRAAAALRRLVSKA